MRRSLQVELGTKRYEERMVESLKQLIMGFCIRLMSME